ncbi:MAG: response regulator [Salinibacterium sp.]|nr:response regulator [Salinibacterium sp.]
MIRVLVVDDEPLAAEAHAQYLGRVDGFELAGIASTAGEALAQITAARERGIAIDLVLLDLTLPDANGLDLARSLRATRVDIDFIAITAVRQTESVQAALAVGAVQYLIKPFGFAAFREKLEHYARYRAKLRESAASATQNEVDALLSSWRSSARSVLPKGLTATTLDSVSAHLRGSGAPLSASELATSLDLSRVTARRYLEHLADTGSAARSQRYGSPGRPEVAYTWRD